MGLFGKKKEKEVEETDMEVKTKRVEKEFKEKRVELNAIIQKITSVKEEYDSTVSNLMLVKKELNQKKMELDIIKRQYRETMEREKRSETAKDTESQALFEKTEGEHSKIKEETDELAKRHEKIKEEISQERATLREIKKQQTEVEKELDEANSRLYNAKTELDKKDVFEDTSILTRSEKEFIGGGEEEKSSAGIIEAASAVVGSLKSKLNTTLKELETVQTLLEKERRAHEDTKKDLMELKQNVQSDES